jgi:hypothetical protein
MSVITCPHCHGDVRIAVTAVMPSATPRADDDLIERVRRFLATLEPERYTYADLQKGYFAAGNPLVSHYQLGEALKAAGAIQRRTSKARYYDVTTEIGKKFEPPFA